MPRTITHSSAALDRQHGVDQCVGLVGMRAQQAGDEADIHAAAIGIAEAAIGADRADRGRRVSGLARCRVAVDPGDRGFERVEGRLWPGRRRCVSRQHQSQHDQNDALHPVLPRRSESEQGGGTFSRASDGAKMAGLCLETGRCKASRNAVDGEGANRRKLTPWPVTFPSTRSSTSSPAWSTRSRPASGASWSTIPGPFTFTGTLSYIVGRGKVAIIDPGPE